MSNVITPDVFDDMDCSDWTLHPDATSVWITVGNISVYIVRTDEGVVVDLFPKGNEGQDSIGSTWALDSEGLPDEQATESG